MSRFLYVPIQLPCHTQHMKSFTHTLEHEFFIFPSITWYIVVVVKYKVAFNALCMHFNSIFLDYILTSTKAGKRHDVIILFYIAHNNIKACNKVRDIKRNWILFMRIWTEQVCDTRFIQKIKEKRQTFTPTSNDFYRFLINSSL